MQAQSQLATGNNRKSGPGGPQTPANIISYKSDRLQLPDYDYNMTPAEIIRYSNHNFDYERYIRDWVAPYSNSALYIRRNGDDPQVRPYSTTTINGSMGNSGNSGYNYGPIYQDSQPDYSNYYKSVGNITTVNVSKPNNFDNDKSMSKRPSNSTLEYLDLSDRNQQGLIGDPNGSYGKLKKDPSYSITSPGTQTYDYYASPIDSNFDVASYVANLDKQTPSSRIYEPSPDLYVNALPNISSGAPINYTATNYTDQPTVTGSVITQPHVSQAQKPFKTTTITPPTTPDDKNKILKYLETLDRKDEQQNQYPYQQQQQQAQPSGSHFRKPDARFYGAETNPQQANDNYIGKISYIEAPKTVTNNQPSSYQQPQQSFYQQPQQHQQQSTYKPPQQTSFQQQNQPQYQQNQNQPAYQPQQQYPVYQPQQQQQQQQQQQHPVYQPQQQQQHPVYQPQQQQQQQSQSPYQQINLPPTVSFVNPSGNLVTYETVVLDNPESRGVDHPSSNNSVNKVLFIIIFYLIENSSKLN